jgi:hypothetical protein
MGSVGERRVGVRCIVWLDLIWEPEEVSTLWPVAQVLLHHRPARRHMAALERASNRNKARPTRQVSSHYRKKQRHDVGQNT